MLPVLAAAALAGLIVSQPAYSAADDVWPVKGRLVGKMDKSGSGFDKAKDVSGIACTTDRGFPRTCLVIDDEAQGAQLVTLTEGGISAGTYIPLTTASFRGEPLELDGEAVAFWKDAFYVMGSHGRARDKKGKLDAEEMLAREIATAQLFRIKVDPRTLTADIDHTVFFWDGTAAVRSLGDLKPYQEGRRPLKPEALLPLDLKGGKLRLLVMFDGATEGGARTVEITAP